MPSTIRTHTIAGLLTIAALLSATGMTSRPSSSRAQPAARPQPNPSNSVGAERDMYFGTDVRAGNVGTPGHGQMANARRRRPTVCRSCEGGTMK